MDKPAAQGELLDFEDHPFPFANALVVLDVDGTLIPDCGRSASVAVADKVRELKARGNEVWLCSNSRRRAYAQRLTVLASQLEVNACPGSIRKPSTLALSGVDRNGRQLVVVGDKDLTDGLLARWSGAQFIKVRRKIDPADRPISRLTNLIDDVFGPIALFLWDAFSALVRKPKP
jgi:predicted HAD superfamily phosphohydrolase YqeG